MEPLGKQLCFYSAFCSTVRDATLLMSGSAALSEALYCQSTGPSPVTSTHYRCRHARQWVPGTWSPRRAAVAAEKTGTEAATVAPLHYQAMIYSTGRTLCAAQHQRQAAVRLRKSLEIWACRPWRAPVPRSHAVLLGGVGATTHNKRLATADRAPRQVHTGASNGPSAAETQSSGKPGATAVGQGQITRGRSCIGATGVRGRTQRE